MTPTTSSTKVLYLAYNLHGSGHYDACVPNENPDTVDVIVKCRCGVNRRESDKESFRACNIGSNRQHSSCKCLAANQACSSLCRCKNCENPNGQRKLLGKRKRELHDWQKVNISNNDFVSDRTQPVRGSWSKLEDIIFANVINDVNH